jgi:glycosyltransferase involved in cell wall biosynthesis
MIKNSSENLPLVGILLATHNPSEFIAEQINSIKQQENVRVKIYWGDYGSSVTNKEYVRNLLKDQDFREYQIHEPGPAENFFFLLEQANEEFIAFSDQDDIWLPRKLINQVDFLRECTRTPGLVHSNSEIIYKGKRLMKKSRCQKHDFPTLAFTNCCQGCTLMINSAARERILSSIPEGIIWHDWWIGLVISLTGKIFYTEQTEVLYRIHGGNLIGLPNFFQRIIIFLNRPTGQISYQINEVVSRFGTLNSNDPKGFQRILNSCSPNWRTRFLSNLTDVKRRQTVTDDFLRRLTWTLRQP